MLHDPLGRTIHYLRLSVTKACAMRCMYCRPTALRQPRDEPILTSAEMEHLVRYLVVRHGLKKVRLTGGEPTDRRDLATIIRRLSSIYGIDEVALTTNGIKLERLAHRLARAGLRRVNVSLDSLDRARFRLVTGVDGLNAVLAGIDAARDAGLEPVRLNTVVIRGQNDHELGSLLQFAADKQLEIRFIELMPMGPLAGVWAKRYVSESQMRDHLAAHVESWEALALDTNAARRYHVTLRDGQTTTVGFITAMSCPFCHCCDRIRVAADGTFYPCLMDQPAGNLLAALRPEVDYDDLERRLAQGMQRKATEHPLTGAGIMTHIGG